MSSGFVSAGTNEQPTERDDDWLRAQQEVEANFRRKQEEGKQTDGKSLYEVLQQNKAAKQEAFEESARLKNQFRTLDDDEVEFLDSVLESTRAKEAAVKKETAEQLEVFRKQREEAEKALLDDASDAQASYPGTASAVEQDTWTTSGKKRRRAKDKETLVGAKLRKRSSSTKDNELDEEQTARSTKTQSGPKDKEPTMAKDASAPVEALVDKTLPSSEKTSSPMPASSKTPPTAVPGLGLAGYSSDED